MAKNTMTYNNNNTSTSSSTSNNTNYNTNYNKYDDSTITTSPQSTNTTNKTDTTTATSAKADDAWKRSPYYAGLRNPGDFGINPEMLDQDKLYDLYAQGAATARDTALAELGLAQNEFGNNIHTAEESYIDTMRKANAGAIQSGASKGIQAANELSALLGLQQQTALEAGKLANKRVDIGNKYAQGMADAAINAEKDVFNRNKIIADILNTALGADNSALGMLNYGALADYLAHNNSGTSNANTTENKSGVTQTTTYR